MSEFQKDEHKPESSGNLSALCRTLQNDIETLNPKSKSDREIKETKIYDLVKLLVATDKGILLMHLMTTVVMPYLNTYSKLKAKEMVTTLVDMVLRMKSLPGQKHVFLKAWIDWAKDAKITHLKLDLEAKLAVVLYGTEKYQEALETVLSLMGTLKEHDYKPLLVKVLLLESRIRYCMSNPIGARVALTSSKATANGIYCPTSVRAALDMQSGIIHAHEKDFKTAYFDFFEAFKNYDSKDYPKARKNLQYMMMCEIMLDKPGDALTFFCGKLDPKYQQDSELIVMKNFAQASINRSLAEFDKTMKEAKKCLEEDHVLKHHLMTFYDHILEQNLCKILEPFCRVQVQHVANLIHLSFEKVEKKLSQMILDKKIHGVLDKETDVMILFDNTPVDKTYENSLELIQTLEKVVDALYQKAEKVT